MGALNEALEEWTRDRVPMDWAMSQNNLGRALCRWGERANNVAKLEQSIAAFDKALLERTRDRVPLDWATTRGNRAEAMALLAEHRGDLAFARLALDQLQEAEVILRDGGHEDFARYSATLIPKAEAVITRLS